MKRAAALILPLLMTSTISCAYLRGVGGPRTFPEPMDADPLAPSAARYEGPLRVPVVEEWHHEMPDDGVWALVRMEMGQPAIDGDRIYIGSSRSPGLLILDRRTGEQLQVVPTDNPVQCRPVVVGNRILVADTGGYVYLLNSDGEKLWRFHAGGAVYTSPLVQDGRVYISTTTDVLVTVELETGAWLWSFRPDETLTRTELSILGSSRPTIRDGLLYAGLSDGRLVCLTAENGVLQWEMTIAEGRFIDVDASPVFTDEGLLLIGSYSGPVVAVDTETQLVEWRYDAGVNGDLTLMYGRVFFADEAGKVYSLDAVDGSEQWTFEVAKTKELFNTPVGKGRILLVTSKQGTIFAIDAFSGEQMWRHEPRLSLLNTARPPTIGDRQVLLLTGDGKLRSFRAPPGFYDTGEDQPAHRESRHLNW